MKMIHKDCGGEVNEDLSVPGYHYNPDTDTANDDDPMIPVYRCDLCKSEIVSDAQISLLRDDWKDPNDQKRHTFGGSPAAERLKDEIDKGARYEGAVRLLNKYNASANELLYCASKFFDVRHLLYLLRKDAVQRINDSGADETIKSLCCNLVVARDRLFRKVVANIESKSTNRILYTRHRGGFKWIGSLQK